MEQVKYRVEAFIVPSGNSYHNTSNQSETDNLKLKLNKSDDTTIDIESNYIKNYINDSFSVEEESIQNLKNCIALEKFIKPNSIDVNKENKNTSSNFYSFLNIPEIKYKKFYNADGECFSSYLINKVHRLTPIDEKNEDLEEKLTDLCHHGCKNGCSVIVSTPQEVSEEVFKGTWLQKLEDIKQREAVLKSRELILEDREKALFKREREIKILERQVKDKLKHLDLQIKENKHSQCLLKFHNSQKNTLQSLVDSDLKAKPEELQISNSVERFDNTDVKLNLCTKSHCLQNMPGNQSEQLDKQIDNIEIMCTDLQQEKANVGSSCSSDNSTTEGKRSKQRLNLKGSKTSKSSYCKFVSNNSKKGTKPCKTYYEDLDSTLSADIGDSSFIQTSQKFNPDLYKKPYAFTRSVSERRGKYANKGSNINLEVQNLDTPIGIEQNKILERVTKNIFASQDKGTKFQHYGLIDHNIGTANTICNVENENKYSYLNLETGNKLYLHQKAIRGSKDRPISWNEESNEWLQKKREAYNMITKKVLPEDIEDKENLKHNVKINKSEKMIKKKDIRNRILTIFR
ncbi:uncharacterized protein LOC143342456 [Colletes latitarsis]|uniref:uncharacterized protein LOC143342456 n=1 Tax=Colletes latitarsis TaxID=2605962 RepID=UPI004035B7E5